ADTSDLASGTLALRDAIAIANGTLDPPPWRNLAVPLVVGPLTTPAPNTIQFNIPGSPVPAITPASPLPAITAPVIIDGFTQPGSAGNPVEHTEVDTATVLVRIDGSALTQSSPATVVDGLTVTAANCTIDGLIITGFTGAGVSIRGANSQGNWLWGNFLGTLPDPTNGRNFPSVATAQDAPSRAAAAALSNGQAGILINSSN